MPPEPLLARNAPQIGDHRTREVERPRACVEHHLRRVGILERLKAIVRREGFDQCGDIGFRIVETAPERLELLAADEGLVALHVHHDVVLATLLAIGLPATVRSAPVVGRGHLDPTAEGTHGLIDPLVVRGDHGIVQHPGHLFVDPLDDGLAAQQGQRFAGKARRSVTRRNDGYEFHRTLYLF